MAREFRLPDIGEGLTEAEIVRWLVAVGDPVESDQPIVEVETDKAVVEIPSPYAGVVVSLGGAEGDVVQVGEVLVTIGESGEADPPSEPESTGPTESMRATSAPIVGTLSEEAEDLSTPPSRPVGSPVSVQALPVVRKLARDNGIDLEMVQGTGPGGRITRADVEAAMARQDPGVEPSEASGAQVAETEASVETPHEPHHEAVEYVAVGAGHGISDEDFDDPAMTHPTEEPAPTRPPDTEDDTAEGGDERRPMSRLRRTIAANMSKSWAEIPHVTTFDDVDATRLLDVRKALGHRHGLKIPLEVLVIKAVLPALDQFPEFNSSIDGDDLVFHSRRDIGIAVDTNEGLMVAVIEDAEKKSVLELAGEVRRLGEGARERSLRPEELTGQTFTVSNIGAVGGGHGTPIIPYGTVAILSIGTARPRPVVHGEALAISQVMPLSLSYDHRVIDGAVGRRFMSLLLENLEEPALFLAG